MDKNPKVFISHASSDRDIAAKIAVALKQRGVDVWFGPESLAPGDSWVKEIDRALSASDYLLVLLSPASSRSPWVNSEVGAGITRDMSTRDITIIPVLIADCDIPVMLAQYQYYDLRTEFEERLEALVEQVGSIPHIDFGHLNGSIFEHLVFDLLERHGFRKLDVGADNGVDMVAEVWRPDPFGAKTKETWLVQCKYHSEDRADARSVKKLVESLDQQSVTSKGLLVTNGSLTSAARDLLFQEVRKRRAEVVVLDGTRLKGLLLKNKDLVRKYFPQGGKNP